MTRGPIAVSLILAVLLALGCSLPGDDASRASPGDGTVFTVSLKDLRNEDAHVDRILIPASGDLIFSVVEIPVDVSFVVFQIHTYQYNVTLSYDRTQLDKVSNRSVFGSNIGLHVDTARIGSTQMYLKNDNIHEVDAMLVVTGYDAKAPIPGGCNMEFDTEVAPYEKLVARDGMTIVDLQPPSPPALRATRCELNPARYAVYRMYLPEQDFTPETYFSALKSMLTVNDILQNADKISPSGFSAMRHVHSAYIGVGSIYVGVATYEDNKAAYVPIASYACSPLLYPETCQILSDSFSKFVCAVIFFLGLFSVFQGPRCMNAEMCLPPLFVGSVLGYILALNVADYSNGINVAIAVSVGILTSIVLSPSARCTMSVMYFLVPGFFFASVAYFAVPDTTTVFQNDWMFGASFVVVVLAVALILCVCPAVNIVLTCAIFGSYMMILPIDYYAGTSLKYIMINVIRRATVPEFSMATVCPPFQAKDKMLVALWCLLFVIRLVRSYCSFCWVMPNLPRLKTVRRAFFVSERVPLLNNNTRPQGQTLPDRAPYRSF